MYRFLSRLALTAALIASATPAGVAFASSQQGTSSGFTIDFEGAAASAGTIKTTPIWVVGPPAPPGTNCSPGGRNSPPGCPQDIDATVNVALGDSAATIASHTLQVLDTKTRLIQVFTFQINPQNADEIIATPVPNNGVTSTQVHFESYVAGVGDSWFPTAGSPSTPPANELGGATGFQISAQNAAVDQSSIKVTVFWKANGAAMSSDAIVAVAAGDTPSMIAAKVATRLNARSAIRGDFSVQVSPSDSTTVIATANPGAGVAGLTVRVATTVEGGYEVAYWASG